MTRCRFNISSRTAGFTLLELLIAVVLMALLSVMCWRGLQSIIDSRDRITLAANEIRAMSTAFT
ncbi:MAG: prepilin-type N-terminal cleavage/methylation domain-containing protein, partial [Burkholderiaceae bacterium]